MLHELLRIMAENPVQDIRGLAEDLAADGIRADRSTVELAILELERKGYLRREPQVAGAGDTAQSAACAGCALRCPGRSAVTWVLTDKALSRP